jgi:hypothetical protein
MTNTLIPDNKEGKATDLHFSVTLSSKEAASECYKRAAMRMRNPPVWRELAGWASAHFLLADADGKELHRLAEKGDYIRIDLPGPGPKAGEGYDWVQIGVLEDHTDPSGEKERIGMTVAPSPAPGRNDKDSAGVAHFFQKQASSTYIIEREGDKVTVWYYGRNEVPNTSTEKTSDNVRNAVVAAGAILSFSELQWSALCKGFLAAEIGG